MLGTGERVGRDGGMDVLASCSRHRDSVLSDRHRKPSMDWYQHVFALQQRFVPQYLRPERQPPHPLPFPLHTFSPSQPMFIGEVARLDAEVQYASPHSIEVLG